MVYKKLKGYKYILECDVTRRVDLPNCIGNKYVNIHRGRLHIRQGYMWDGASGAADTPDFMSAALVHDAIYQLIRMGEIHPKYRKYADQVLRDICIEHGMSKFRAGYVYSAVRLLGGRAIKPRGLEGNVYIFTDGDKDPDE